MAYPEPNGLGDIYGPGAEEAESFAEALDVVTEAATKAGVSYRTIIKVIEALALAAEADSKDRAAEKPDPVPCPKCDGLAGHFTGDPCHGTEGWQPCARCNGSGNA
jgi:hypothetical protein